MLSFLKIKFFWRKCTQKALKISLSLPKKKKQVAAPFPHPSLGHPLAKTTQEYKLWIFSPRTSQSFPFCQAKAAATEARPQLSSSLSQLPPLAFWSKLESPFLLPQSSLSLGQTRIAAHWHRRVAPQTLSPASPISAKPRPSSLSFDQPLAAAEQSSVPHSPFLSAANNSSL